MLIIELRLASSGNNPGSTLLLDDLSFTGGNVSLEEFAEMNVSVYPNPATNLLYIKAQGTYAFEIIDLTGKILMSETNIDTPTSVNIEQLQSGSYLVHIVSNGKYLLEKLVID